MGTGGKRYETGRPGYKVKAGRNPEFSVAIAREDSITFSNFEQSGDLIAADIERSARTREAIS